MKGLFVFGLSSWISPYTSASAGESLDGEEESTSITMRATR
jgi:hypothetical protein